MQFPKEGTPRAELVAALDRMRAHDADWHGGRTWSLVYFVEDELTDLLKEAYTKYFSTNGLSPMAFPSLKRMEAEVLAMTADLFHGAPDAAGSMTSGGTESIIMAVLAARERARAERGVTAPEMVVPITAHPAFEKAGHYLQVKPVRIPVGPDYRADVAAARAAVNERTVLVVGSAPGFPQGVVDPIPELAAIAAERGIGCHVDACLGGFLLPFVERLGHAVPPWDFRVPGVTSISADLHKYGFSARGASAVLYRTKELRRHQFFVYPDWPGGLYGSPTAAGSRPGGAIAAAWTVLTYLGEAGYVRLARKIMDTTRALTEGIGAIPGLRVVGRPDMSVFAFTSETVDVYALAGEMERLGWHLDRQQLPPSLHMMVTPAHERIVARFLDDLGGAVARLGASGAAPEGAAAMYGMMATLPDRGTVQSMVLEFMDGLDAVDA